MASPEQQETGYEEWEIKTEFRTLADAVFDYYAFVAPKFRLPWHVTELDFIDRMQEPGSGLAQVILRPGELIGRGMYYVDGYDTLAIRNGLRVGRHPNKIAIMVAQDDPEIGDSEPWKRLVAFDLTYESRGLLGRQRIGMELDGLGTIQAMRDTAVWHDGERVDHPPTTLVTATVSQLKRYIDDVRLLTGIEN